MDFPGKTVDEIKVYTFDFAPEIATGTVLTLPVVTKSTVRGADTPTADGFTLASPSIVGTKLLILGSAGVEGARYKMRAQVTGANGEKHVIWAFAEIKEAAGKSA